MTGFLDLFKKLWKAFKNNFLEIWIFLACITILDLAIVIFIQVKYFDLLCASFAGGLVMYIMCKFPLPNNNKGNNNG